MNKIENSNFKRLIGVWETTGDIKSGQHSQKLVGTDSYELILGGNYILHRADVMMGNDRSETFEIIMLDNALHEAKMQYFNSREENGIMKCSTIGDEFKIEGTGLKFSGVIDEENTKINGKWYIKANSEGWRDFIDLHLVKRYEI